MTLPNKVRIVEVGPRDGLQSEENTLSVKDRVQFINLLSESGFQSIEVGSFVSPKWVPQLAQSGEVYDHIQKKKGVDYSLLVPNLRGFEEAVSHDVRSTAVFTAASETFCQKNINMTIEESLEGFSQFLRLAKEKGMRVRGYVSCAIACPYEGMISPVRVNLVAEKLLSLGCDEISLGDTTGEGTPKGVKQLLNCLSLPQEKLAVHFHDTYGQGIANIYAALEEGISIIDSSVSGLGGCPYSPGSSGNVSTEDVLYLLEGLGIQTGVNIEKILKAGSYIDEKLNRQTTSKATLALRGKAKLS